MRESVLEQVLGDSDETFFIIGEKQCVTCSIVLAYLEEYKHPYILFELTDANKPVVESFLKKHRKPNYKLPVVIHNGTILDGFESCHTIMDFLEEHYESGRSTN